VGYIIREEHTHAKAGNINHALTTMNSPYVAIFDCDHVPTRSFLQMTLGWMLADPRLAMLQTPHHFYSPDPFERNLLQYKTIPNEAELFYGIVQDGNDFWNATFFCGSCALIRRSALDEVGGIATETVTEDAHTSLRMQKRGYNTAYINIPQAAGLATETLSAHVGQRIRWARGMIQILRTENPLFAWRMKFSQRLCYFNAMLHFLYALPRLVFLTAPLAYLLFGISNFYGYWLAILGYAMPHVLLANMANARVQGKYRASFWNEVFETALAPYILMPTLLALFNPRSGKFNVTHKGGLVPSGHFDRNIAWPFIGLLALNLAGVGFAIARLLWGDPSSMGTVLMNLGWTGYNIVILGATVAVAWEARQLRRAVRLDVAVPITLRTASQKTITAIAADVSMSGLAVEAHGLQAQEGETLSLSFDGPCSDCSFTGSVVRRDGSRLCLEFDRLNLFQEEALTRVLYSRADSWLNWSADRRPDRPLRSFLHLLGISLRGLALTPKGLLADSESTPRTPRREPGISRPRRQAVIPMIVLAGLLLAPLATPASASAPVLAQPGGNQHADRQSTQFQDALDLRSLGQKQPIVLRGPDSRFTLYFGVPPTKVVTRAGLSLHYAISNPVGNGESQLNILVNGARAATLNFGSELAGSAKLELPADLLTRDNALAFELSGAGLSWVRIEMESELAIAGQMLPLANDLGLAPSPFLDLSVQRTASLPLMFSGKLENDTLAAAGVVASWLGAFADQRGLQFSVVTAMPPGNFVLCGTASSLPAGLELAVSGPMVAIRTNPRDPYGKVLVVTGTTSRELLVAARALVAGKVTSRGDTMIVDASQRVSELPAYAAPRWLSAERVLPIGDYTRAEELQVSGNGSVNVYFRLPPDLYLAARSSVPLRLNYRFVGAGRLTVQLNGVTVASLPVSATSEADSRKSEYVEIPANGLRPFRNTLTFDFAFERGRDHAGAILRNSELDLRGLRHFTAMPRLELFSEAGFPFTRAADLARTAVVMPENPTPAELEFFLNMSGFFGAQTGSPMTLLTVVDAAGIRSVEAKDLVVLGSAEDQPLLSDWAAELPVTIDQGDFRTSNRVSWAQRLQTGYLLSSMANTRLLRELLRSDIQADGVIEGLRSPLNSARSAVVFALRDRNHDSFSRMFLPAGTAGSVYGTVSIAQNGRFHSFALAESYELGALDLRNTVSFWVHTYLWIMPVAALLGASLCAAWLRRWLERRARLRLALAES
jgi:cellulose synthase (UDP-forming)